MDSFLSLSPAIYTQTLNDKQTIMFPNKYNIITYILMDIEIVIDSIIDV